MKLFCKIYLFYKIIPFYKIRLLLVQESFLTVACKRKLRLLSRGISFVFSLGGKVYTGNTQIYYIFISVHSVIQLQFFPICGLQHHRSDHKPMLPLRTCNCHGLYLSLLPQEAVRCLQPEFHLMFSLSWQCDLPRSGSQ